MKKCSRCGKLKSVELFSKCKTVKSGYKSQCKDCDSEYYKNNKISALKVRRKYYKNNRTKRLEDMQDYYCLNRDKILEDKQLYYKENIHKIREYKKVYELEYYKNRLKTDVNFKLTKYLRARLGVAVRRNYKSGSAVRDLGCSIEFFKQYIQFKFYSNMSWDNWGSVWELDHIKPLHKFDLSDREQFLEVVHYTNLQPLTIKDHKLKTITDLRK